MQNNTSIRTSTFIHFGFLFGVLLSILPSAAHAEFQPLTSSSSDHNMRFWNGRKAHLENRATDDASAATFQQFMDHMKSVPAADKKAELDRIFKNYNEGQAKKLEGKNIRINPAKNVNGYLLARLHRDLALQGELKKQDGMAVLNYYANSAAISEMEAQVGSGLNLGNASFGDALSVNLGSGPYVIRTGGWNIEIDEGNDPFTFNENPFDKSRPIQVKMIQSGGQYQIQLLQGEDGSTSREIKRDGDRLEIRSSRSGGNRYSMIIPVAKDEQSDRVWYSTQGHEWTIQPSEQSQFPKIEGSKITLDDGIPATSNVLVILDADGNSRNSVENLNSASEAIAKLKGKRGFVAASTAADARALINSGMLPKLRRTSSIEWETNRMIELMPSGMKICPSWSTTRDS